MSLHLTTSDLARCEFASRVMLSPLNVASIDAWRSEVSRTLCELFQADAALFVLPQADALFLSDAFTPAARARCTELLRYDRAGTLRSSDPVLDRWMAATRQAGQDVFATDLAAGTGGAPSMSAFYREVMAPAGLGAVQGLRAAGLQGEAMLWLFFKDGAAGPFGAEGMLLLRALLPAFKAGVEMFARLEAHRTALDALSEPLLVLDLQGRELHRNRAFTALVDAEPEGDHLIAEAQREVRNHGGDVLAALRSGYTPAEAGREVRTSAHAYRLRSTLVTPGILGSAGTIMIAYEQVAVPVLPPAEALRKHFGLTRREAEVTLLMAEGLSNQDVADRLFVSSHTARRHTENVLSKLGLHSRKAIALKLLEMNHSRPALPLRRVA